MKFKSKGSAQSRRTNRSAPLLTTTLDTRPVTRVAHIHQYFLSTWRQPLMWVPHPLSLSPSLSFDLSLSTQLYFSGKLSLFLSLLSLCATVILTVVASPSSVVVSGCAVLGRLLAWCEVCWGILAMCAPSSARFSEFGFGFVFVIYSCGFFRDVWLERPRGMPLLFNYIIYFYFYSYLFTCWLLCEMMEILILWAADMNFPCQ